MIIDCYRHCFLGIFLSYYKVIQLRLNLMRCRNILDIQDRLTLFAFFFLLDLLLLWDHILKIIHTEHLHSRHIQKLAVIHLSAWHHIKARLHAVRTHTDMIRQIHHLAGLAFRSVTDEAYLFIFIIIFLLIFDNNILVIYFFYFIFQFVMIHIIFFWHSFSPNL